jgi:predicted phosphodiesterase
MSSKSRLTKAYKQAKVIEFNINDKFILFSDCHRGDNSFADDFANNKNIYLHALNHYYERGFQYCELGDGDELWENRSFKTIFNAHKNVYELLKKFHDKNRMHLIWGNHDMVYKNPNYVKKHLSSFLSQKSGKEEPLFPNLKYQEGIILRNNNIKQDLFLTHGHQADWWNYICWKWSRFFVRFLWKPLQIMGISDPTSPAKNYKELIKVERRIKKWINASKTLITIVGHTHRPRFPKPGETPLFNDGSCVHPRSITGIEIENNSLCLIKWHIKTKQDGTLQIKRTVLEGPELILKYQRNKSN